MSDLNSTPDIRMATARTRSSSAMFMQPKMGGDDRAQPPSASKQMKSSSMSTLRYPTETAQPPSTLKSTTETTLPYPTNATKPAPEEEEPAYLRNDPGLACLRSQLARVNAQIRVHEEFKQRVADAEEQCRRELEEKKSVAKSLAEYRKSRPSRSNSTTVAVPAYHDAASNYLDQWVKHWDTEVGAEYWYNTATGEASWLDPRYGNIAA